MADSQKKNTLVLGLGGLGALFALFLQRSGRTALSTVARSNYSVVKDRGILIPPSKVKLGGVNEGGTVHFDHVFPALSGSDSKIDVPVQYDYIVICTKALKYAKPSLVESLEPFVTPGKTVIALIQNGIGIEDDVQARWPQNLVLTCVCFYGGQQTSPGTVVHTGGSRLTVGPFVPPSSPFSDPSSTKPYLEELGGMLREGGCDVNIFYDAKKMQVHRWQKLAWNAAWNGLTALSNLDTGAFFDSSSSAAPLALAVMNEAVTVARAAGLEIDPLGYIHSNPSITEEEKAALRAEAKEMGLVVDEGIAEEYYRRIVKQGPTTSSMRGDVLAGRTMEVDVIYGNLYRKAVQLGVPAPRIETLYVLVAALDARNDGRVKVTA